MEVIGTKFGMEPPDPPTPPSNSAPTAMNEAATARFNMGTSGGWTNPSLGMNAQKMGRTSGFRECVLTLCEGRRNLATVRKRKPAEPRQHTERWNGGMPESEPQGEPKGGREDVARRHRGSALSPARGSRSKRVEGSDNGWSVLRTGDFPGVAGPGLGWDCPTRSRHDVGGLS
jgi:hypothetical protein